MHPRRALLLPVVIAAGLAAAAPATAGTSRHAPAHLLGGDPPPTIPSIVQTRLTRTENALERMTEYVDDQDSVKTGKVAKVIRRQTAAAWRGAKYYLRTAPPPVATDALRSRGLRAHARVSGGAIGPVVADQYATAVAVFGLVHDVSAGMIEMTDGAHGTTLTAMSRTMFWTLDKRDAMVKEAEAFEPPAPPAGAAARRSGTRRLHGALVVGGFAGLMPQVTAGLDDETQHIEGLRSDATDLRPRGASMLRQAEVQILLTERTINAFWPPVPAEG
jgi:hypothetical protein